MTRLKRNHSREDMRAKGVGGEWWTADMGALAHIHVYQERAGGAWRWRIAALTPTDSGLSSEFATRDDAWVDALSVLRVIASALLDILTEVSR